MSTVHAVLLVELRGLAAPWRTVAEQPPRPSESWLASFGPVRTYVERAAAEMPVLLTGREHPADELRFARRHEAPAAAYRILHGRSRLYVARPGVGVLSMEVTAIAADVEELVDLLGDAGFRKDRMIITRAALPDLAVQLAADAGLELQRPRLGRIHQIVVAGTLPEFAAMH